jgi:hypothetical protein
VVGKDLIKYRWWTPGIAGMVLDLHDAVVVNGKPHYEKINLE